MPQPPPPAPATAWFRATGQRTATGRGILFMLLGSAGLTLNDAVMKWLIADYPVGEMLFFRGGAVALAVGLLLWRLGGASGFRVADPKGQSFRAALMVAGSFLFITGLKYLPLADAIAIAFAGPLFATALAVPLLGERVGWRRWLAVGSGFGGVLLMTRPSGEVIQWAVLLPLAACLTGAFRDIVTRRLTATDSTLATLFYSTSAVALAGLVTLPWGWRLPEPAHLAMILASSALMAGAHWLADRGLPLRRSGNHRAIPLFVAAMGADPGLSRLGRAAGADGGAGRPDHRLRRPLHLVSRAPIAALSPRPRAQSAARRAVRPPQSRPRGTCKAFSAALNVPLRSDRV